jgi:ABC-type nitrate/sulfonate/bicarbonate transport system permease component
MSAPASAAAMRRLPGMRFAGYLLSLGVVLLAWEYASSKAIIPMLLPSPESTLRVAQQLWAKGQLQADMLASVVRILSGFAIGSAIGIPIGLLMGSFRPIRLVFEPYVQFLRFLPALAWIPAAMMWLGTGEGSKIALLVYTTVFVVALNTMIGVASVPRNQVRAALCFGATRWQVFFWVTIPATVAYMVTGMRLAMGNCFQTVVAAELVASDSGLGYLIFSARQWMQTEVAYVGIAFLGAIGILTDLLFQFTARRLLKRYERQPHS